MRTTIVPAQITTVEDRIAGNLTLPQIFLLLLPIFLGGFMYISFPPYMNFAVYKIVLFFIIATISSLLAIRFKDKMVISWLIIFLRFANRPKYFVFNKNDMYERVMLQTVNKEVVPNVAVQKEEAKKHQTIQQISMAQVIKLEKFLNNPKANARFIFKKKGGLHVSFSEVQ
jgi:hypothetical protein